MTADKPKKRGILSRVLCVIGVIALIIAGGVGLYAYDNLSYQDRLMDHVWAAGYSEKQVELPDGTVLNYGEGGPATSTPLLLLHGQQVAWEDYARVLPQLAEKYHVYAVDCHGHGKSSHDPARYTCAAMTEDFAWFVENVIKEPCILSGHSSGGVLATNLAATHPDYALGLLIEDAPFYCFQPDDMKARDAFVWKDGFEIIHNFLNQSEETDFCTYYFRHGYMWSLFGGLNDVLADMAKSYSIAHPGEALKLWQLPYSMANALYYTHDYDLLFGDAFYNGTWFAGLSEDNMLKSVTVPTVYLKANTVRMADGTLTCANTNEDAQRVTELIPNCQRITMPSNAHDIHFVNPDGFLDGLDRLAAQL